MTHQLDFHVTLWIDDPETLLQTEHLLKLLEGHTSETGGSDVHMRMHTLASLFRSLAYYGVTQLDVHSMDINWDDVPENEVIVVI